MRTDLERRLEAIERNQERIIRMLEQGIERRVDGLTGAQHVSIREEALEIHRNGWPDRRRGRRS